MDSGRQKFTAVLEHPQAVPGWDDLREGALLKLSGVCEIQWNQRSVPPSPEAFRLLLRTPADVQIIRHAPWWTLARAMKILGGLLTLVLLAAVWVTALRRRVSNSNLSIAKANGASGDARSPVAAIAETRKRGPVGRRHCP